MKEKLQSLTHFNMALVGGFFGGFAIWNFMELFGNAQTANMIGIVKNIIGGNFADVMLRVVGFLIYFSGFALSVVINKLTNLNIKYISLIIDFIALITVFIMPKDRALILCLYPIFFAMPFQWVSFGGAEGFTSSTIFSTNNLRQFSTSFVEYLCDKDKTHLKKTAFFGKTLLSYHIGVAIACVLSVWFGISSVLLGIFPLISATIMVFMQSDRVEVTKKPFKIIFISR